MSGSTQQVSQKVKSRTLVSSPPDLNPLPNTPGFSFIHSFILLLVSAYYALGDWDKEM